MENDVKKPEQDDDVLLRVEHLCQYFKMGPGLELKAVDDVSFDVKKGEVFGLVGESGCGKTTTGRSIIKLYDITSGNVYFKGQRICAGVGSYKKAIKDAKLKYAEEVSAIKKQQKEELAANPDDAENIKAKFGAALREKREELDKVLTEQKALIRSAKQDHKNCEKIYLKKLTAEYNEAVEKAGSFENLSDEDKEKYRPVEILPKTPKKAWHAGILSILAIAVVFFITSIALFAGFNAKYGKYESANAVIEAMDSATGTTTVSFTVQQDGNMQDLQKDLSYYDASLGKYASYQRIGATITAFNSTERTTTVAFTVDGVDYSGTVAYYDTSIKVNGTLSIYYNSDDPNEIDAQTVRLFIYYNPLNTDEISVKKPRATAASMLMVASLVDFVACIVTYVVVKEKYNPARLVTKIQMIFQDPIASLNPRMTVKDIIAEGLVIGGEKDKKYIEKQVYEVLELVGLVREHAGRYPHEFSGGQRQRIGVARSVIMKPDLIIADEPISALDVSIQAQVINLLNELRNKLGLTILFIAHDLSVVKYFSDRIGVMYFGKMVELATSDELFEHPLHPYTRSLLSAIPLPDPEYEKNRKRFVYNPLAEHDYSVDKPTLKEVLPGHFVYCNQAEFDKYTQELSKAK